MSVLEEHGAELHQHGRRLDDHDVKIDKIDESVHKVNMKVDVIDSTTKGTASAVGTLIKQKGALKDADGTINQRDWLGTLSIIIFTILQLGVMAWQLWSVQNGKDNIFLASLSVMAIPTIIAMGKSLTGRDIKKSDTSHLNELAKKEKEYKAEINKMSGIMQMKDVEIYGHKEKIARLETMQDMVKKENPSIPRLPPTL